MMNLKHIITAFLGATGLAYALNEPTGMPTGLPSSLPTGLPSSLPTELPSGQPTGFPSCIPTSLPSGQPSGQPSLDPSGQPSSRPSSQPSPEPVPSFFEEYQNHIYAIGAALSGLAIYVIYKECSKPSPEEKIEQMLKLEIDAPNTNYALEFLSGATEQDVDSTRNLPAKVSYQSSEYPLVAAADLSTLSNYIDGAEGQRAQRIGNAFSLESQNSWLQQPGYNWNTDQDIAQTQV